jgi:hypothetical protein
MTPAAPLLIAVLLASAGPADVPPEAGPGFTTEAFLQRAAIRVERQIGKPPTGPEQFEAVALTSAAETTLRGVLLTAFHRRVKQQQTGAESGRAAGGVLGRVSFNYRLTFTHGSNTQASWLHLCPGWLAGGPLLPNLVFTAKEREDLETVLGPCKPSQH